MLHIIPQGTRDEMKLSPKKISFSNNIIRGCQVAPVVGIFWNPVGSPPLTQVEYTLSVLEKSTQSLWEKLVAWPRCISRQYVGKVGEKAWKMPWEPSGIPETGMVDKMGLHWTGGDFISRWRSRGARWLSSQEIQREEMIGTNYCGIYFFQGHAGRTRETHIRCVLTPSSH